MFHVTVNANSIVQPAFKTKNRIRINANSSVKSIISAKKIIVSFVQMVKI